jgi:hypothetical protein
VTLRPQISLGIAGGNNQPTAAHSAKCGGRFKTEFPSFGRDQVGNLMCFEMPPHILDWIEFGRVSRQPFDHAAALGAGHVVFYQQAPVDRCAIPDDQHFPGNMALEMAQKLDDLEAFDAAGVNLEIEPPERQAADDRKAFPVEGLVQHRGLPARGPSARPRWASAQSAFVDKDDGSLLLSGLFFKAGQPARCQRRTAFASRSTARRSGRWQLKPLAPSHRQT